MSKALKDQISRGEDLATSTLRQVFGFSLDPDSDSAAEAPSTVPQAQSSQPSTHSTFNAEDYAGDGKRHLLLACSGSVATIKLPNMLQALQGRSANLSIRVILTASAAKFLKGQSAEQPNLKQIRGIQGLDGIHFDEDEWDPAWTRGAPILHIELRRWADMLVIAPLSANTMGKMVGGLCDNLLTSVVRAWDTETMIGFPHQATSLMSQQDGTQRQTENDDMPGLAATNRKLILVAPAMNTAMWRHPLTAQHIRILEEWPWIKVLRPVEKSLACGDVGTGAMKPFNEIVADVEQLLCLSPPPANK